MNLGSPKMTIDFKNNMFFCLEVLKLFGNYFQTAFQKNSEHRARVSYDTRNQLDNNWKFWWLVLKYSNVLSSKNRIETLTS